MCLYIYTLLYIINYAISLHANSDSIFQVFSSPMNEQCVYLIDVCHVQLILMKTGQYRRHKKTENKVILLSRISQNDRNHGARRKEIISINEEKIFFCIIYFLYPFCFKN